MTTVGTIIRKAAKSSRSKRTDEVLVLPSTKPAEPRRPHASATTRTLHGTMGDIFGVPLRSDADVLRLQREGVPLPAFERLAARLPASGAEVVVSRSSRRRRSAAGVLSAAESEKALRVARVLAHAIELFGDEQEAQEWLARPGDYVPGEAAVSPLELCAHEAGAQLIENRVLRAQYGMP